ncbi:hypothetical protein WICMUC_004538 [Wickerhamomyces mucosus]|uniref:Exonuclease domain-containing protein n=1 Tax=Wickerhamomyces mucosus TaxID=1378264 RepID=A0A9P8PHP0_9ASCO|nr:hypothetical protein WICMUC_004538 [Wickerhamomyces mucosus]
MAEVKDDIRTNVSKLKISNEPHSQHSTALKSKRRRSSAARTSNTSSASSPARLLNKEKKRKSLANPTFELSTPEKPIRFSQLQQFLLFALGADDNQPAAFRVTNRQLIEKVVMLIIPGLEISKLGSDDVSKGLQSIAAVPELAFFNDHFNQFLLMTAPGSKDSIYPLMNALTTRKYTKKEKKQIRDELSVKKLVLPDLVMSTNELSSNGYPIHPLSDGIMEPVPLLDGWKDTFKFEHDGSHTFSLDCEMCESASGKVLTRISLIDFTGAVLIDEYVKPEEEIIDYLTRYSGITEELLRDVSTTLGDIQSKVLSIVSSDDFLIGHSLENDLKVLKIRHPKIVDTALVFEHPKGPPFKSSLKYLTQSFLGRTIQDGSHDSVTDAQSCLDLVKLKLIEGPLLGKVIDGESVFKDLERIHKKGVVIDYLRVQASQNYYKQCFNDDEVTDAVIDQAKSHNFVVGNLKDFELKSADTQLPVLNDRLNKRLEKIYTSLPPNTLINIITGTGDVTEMNELIQRKKRFEKDYANKSYESLETSWTSADEQKLKAATTRARLGAVLGKIKTTDIDENAILV